jgi:hypothetical protein
MGAGMKASRTVIAALTAALLGTAMAQTPPPAPPAPAPESGGEEVQPRFIWGILIQLAVSRLGGFAWDMFTKWLEARMTGGAGSLTDRLTLGLSGNSGASIRPRAAAGDLNARAADIVVGTPSAPLTVEGGRENYQGANVAILAAEPNGTSFAVRPVNQGFKTGERFKLRVISTFGGELSIENINPLGERKQIYPPQAHQVVVLAVGKETFIPIEAGDYFEFAGKTGKEQLVVNLADPRATGDRASRNKVFRQDVQYGSNFMQEVTPETYPFISQAIDLQHGAN